MQCNLETLFNCRTDYNDARVVIFGAPFDSTTSYRPGARFAGRVMRAEAYGLETYSPYQDRDLADAAFFDSGELELPIGDSEKSLAIIEQTAAQIWQDSKIPFLLGGEHLVSLGAIRAAVAKFADLTIVHFDAHTDLRDEYLGVRLSHASVIRRAWDIMGDGRIFQFGIRSGEGDEFRWAKEHTYLHKFDFNTLDEIIEQIKGRNVYLTVDLDVLDPSVFSGTGTPEAGGVSFLELLHAILSVIDGCKPIGMDLVELSPPCDPSGVSTAVALKILRESLLALNF